MDGYNVTFYDDLAWRGYSFSDDGTKFCEEQPTSVYSFGVWEKLSQYRQGMLIWDYTLPNLEVTIFLVLCLWQFFYFLLKKIYLPVPKITSMMLVRVFFLFLFFFFVSKSYALIDRIFFENVEGRGSLEPDESFAE